MVKAEWGIKRTCPKCGTRFYDLGKEDPVVCISCGVAWDPEPVLKSKQPWDEFSETRTCISWLTTWAHAAVSSIGFHFPSSSEKSKT